MQVSRHCCLESVCCCVNVKASLSSSDRDINRRNGQLFRAPKGDGDQRESSSVTTGSMIRHEAKIRCGKG